jgi:hypothetical protein
MKKIIYTDKETNNFCLVTPSNKYIDNLEFVAERSIPKDCEYFIIDDQDLPKNSEFFDAFCIQKTTEGVSVVVDIPKAKEIWVNHYRTARTPLLAALDVDFMRAVESVNTDLQKEIAQKKQALRDVTKTELPDDLEGIKTTWPEILGQNPFA